MGRGRPAFPQTPPTCSVLPMQTPQRLGPVPPTLKPISNPNPRQRGPAGLPRLGALSYTQPRLQAASNSTRRWCTLSGPGMWSFHCVMCVPGINGHSGEAAARVEGRAGGAAMSASSSARAMILGVLQAVPPADASRSFWGAHRCRAHACCHPTAAFLIFLVKSWPMNSQLFVFIQYEDD